MSIPSAEIVATVCNRPDAAWASVASLDTDTGIRECLAQGLFDARRFTAFDVLQVKRRTRQHFDAALQHTAGGADSSLVLIETLRGRISTHADIHAVVIAAPVGIVEQD